MARGDTTTERLEMDVILDPDGVRSQLAQIKQQIGLELQGTAYSMSQSAGAVGMGFNSLSRDIGAVFGSVLASPTAMRDPSSALGSAIHGLVPSLTAPRSYDVEEWGKLHRDSLVRTSMDWAARAGMAIPGLVGDVIGGSAGAYAGMGLVGYTTGSALGAAVVPGVAQSFGSTALAVAGGLPGAIVGSVLAGVAVDAVMDPIRGRYAAGSAIRSGGGRFGISVSDEVMDGIDQARTMTGFTGMETAEVLRAGLETGAFGQVGSGQEFTQRFKQLMRGAKQVAQDLHVELSESVSLISQMQQAGFGSIEGGVGALRMARVTAAMTGITNEESVALAQAGAGLTVGNLGMSAQAGSTANLANFQAVTLGLRRNVLDSETVTQLGGRAQAAATITAQGLNFLEGPLGRAHLLAAYDPVSGTLDPGRMVVEPGMAFHQALQNVYSTDNPMRTLLEFAGNRARVASSASPEEVALAQVSTWNTLARHIDPKGPITQDMLVGAATQMGVNADTARGILATLDPGVLADRQQAMMQEMAAAHGRANATPWIGARVWTGMGNLAESGYGAIGGASTLIGGGLGALTFAGANWMAGSAGLLGLGALGIGSAPVALAGAALGAGAAYTWGLPDISPYTAYARSLSTTAGALWYGRGGAEHPGVRAAAMAAMPMDYSGVMADLSAMAGEFNTQEQTKALLDRARENISSKLEYPTLAGNREEIEKRILELAPEFAAARTGGMGLALSRANMISAAMAKSGDGPSAKIFGEAAARVLNEPGEFAALGAYGQQVLGEARAGAGISLLASSPVARSVLEAASQDKLGMAEGFGKAAMAVLAAGGPEASGLGLGALSTEFNKLQSIIEAEGGISVGDLAAKTSGFRAIKNQEVLRMAAGSGGSGSVADANVLDAKELQTLVLRAVEGFAIKRGFGGGSFGSIGEALDSLSVSRALASLTVTMQKLNEILPTLKN